MKQRLGHYEIVAELGRGGMGVVYKAVDPALDRIVAIKELAPALADDRTLVERFLREARAMAALSDPHVVNIHFIGQSEDQPFFVMEYIEGESISALLKRLGRIEVGDALKLVQQAALGLASAHRRGLVHRDVKPANLLVDTAGRVRVADFGIALPTRDAASKLTGTGEFVGTPGYVSPEICNGQPVDARSDVFSLGVVLFEMLTGRLPFADTSPLRLMLEVVNAQIPDVQELNGAVDAEAAAILAKMVAKDPADRFQHAGEVAEALARHPLVASGVPLRLVVRPPDPDTMAANALQAARVPTPPPVLTPASAATPIRPGVAAQPQAGGTVVRGQAGASASQVHRDRRLAVAALVLLLLAGTGYAFRDYFRGFANGFRDGFVAGSVSNPVPAGQAATGAFPATAAADPAAASTGAGPALDDGRGADPVAGEAGLAATAPATGEPTPAMAVAASSPSPESPSGIDSPTLIAGGEAAPSATADQPASTPSAVDGAAPAAIATSSAAPAQAAAAAPAQAPRVPAQAARAPAPPRLAPARIVVVAQGDRLLALPARQAVEQYLADSGHDLADAEALAIDEGVGVAGLLRQAARHARVLVLVRAEPAGSRELSFHGQRDVAYTAALSVRAYDTATGQPLGVGLSEQVEFANLNARARAQEAVAPALPGLARTVAPVLARRG
ncbi:MAG: serine/threonine protein kinase [Xanthomonadales bacterium]|nr:serine/threonine protein kinase [Xanthomonadales bacterium]